MTAAILRAHFGDEAVLATQGNLNNAIGLPLTLLRLRASHRAAVVELGMNHRGETRELGAIAQPTIAIVNNAQREHQEFMTSVDEVAAEHADAILALRPRGTAVINADDAHAGRLARCRAQRRRARWSTSASTTGATCRRAARCAPVGSDIELRTYAGNARVELHVPGAAHGAATRWRRRPRRSRRGVPLDAILRGLAAFRPVAGRLSALHATRARWSSTTRTTRIPIRCAPRSTCSRTRRAPSGWCWATWAKSARRARHSIARSARTRKERGIERLFATGDADARDRGGVRRGRRARRDGRRARAARAARGHRRRDDAGQGLALRCAWSASSRR